MAVLFAFPIFGFAVILQTAIVSRLQVLHGSADLILLLLVAWSLQEGVKRVWLWAAIGAGIVAFVSAAPAAATILGYFLAVGLARLLQGRIWQAPLLAMFFTVAVSTILQQGSTLLFLNLSGSPIPLAQGFSRVILPSAFLNLIGALPVYALVTDFANLVYPVEEVE